MTVANGHLYWWPYVCDCQLTLYGVTCLGPAGTFDFQPDAPAAERLETFDNDAVQTIKASSADWPMFRANSQATATSTAQVPATTRLLWETKPSDLDGVRPTAPVAAGGMVFLAGTDGVIRAIDAATGQSRWQAYTECDVRFPPTIWQGRALTASGDGWVYAHEAVSGKPLWRFRAAPQQRKIPVFGELLSTWPAASGVLVDNDVAYVAAGLVNYDGTYVYALDPSNGQLKWCNDTSGHLDAEAKSGVSVQGHLLVNNGKLYLAGGNAVSPAIYDATTGKCLNDPAPLQRCESTSPRGWELFSIGDRVIACGRPFYAHPDMPIYDHTVTQKMLHTSLPDRDIVWLDNQVVACFKPIDRQALNSCVTDEETPRHVIQAWGSFKVKDQPLWHHKCPDSVALAVTRNAVVVADNKQVRAVSLITGQPMWTHELPAAPVAWGMAVDAEGRVVLTLRDGRVICIGA